MQSTRVVIGALSLALGACSAVEPLTCPDTPYFHLDEDGTPVCGISSSPDVPTWEVRDWPAGAPEVTPLAGMDDMPVLYGRLLEVPGDSCTLDVDAFRFSVPDGLPRFLDAEVRALVVGGSGGDVFIELESPPGEATPFTGLDVGARAPLLLFHAPTTDEGPAIVKVEQLELDGATGCPPTVSYRVELTIRGEASVTDLGLVDGTGPVSRRVASPSGVQLFSVESATEAPLRASYTHDSHVGIQLEPEYLRVGADGSVSYVSQEEWSALPDTRRYLEVRPIAMESFELTVSVDAT
ncbi:MAG: hypothetical protein KC619_19040 [Myxococcales bacterium]|nr:hypothetical protein [Myxococcales bacterium]